METECVTVYRKDTLNNSDTSEETFGLTFFIMPIAKGLSRTAGIWNAVLLCRQRQSDIAKVCGRNISGQNGGGIYGRYEVEGLPVTPYLVPQECGMHMETECVTVYRKDTLNNSDTSEETFGLTFRACGEKFGFSCLPYTSEELENATHQEELPLPRRTVVCICGSVRGVGGIDSWGSDVEDPYRISAQKDIVYEFVIE